MWILLHSVLHIQAIALNVTVPDTRYRRIADMGARERVAVERIVAAALTEQMSGLDRVEQMAARGSRERFPAALDKVPTAEPAPEDRI
jgi:hypothetical protein